MSETDHIIDAPLENKNPRKESYLASNQWDYGVNVFLLTTTGLMALLGFMDVESGALFFAALGAFAIGVYQVISSFIGASRGNKSKQIYLLVAIVYVIILFIGGSTGIERVFDNYEAREIIFIGFIFGIPAVMSCFYTKLCYNAYQRAKQDSIRSDPVSEI